MLCPPMLYTFFTSYPHFLWITIFALMRSYQSPHIGNLFAQGELSTESVDKFSTLSTLDITSYIASYIYQSYPQKVWISFPHYPHWI